MGAVRVVTDSTGALPAALVDELGVRVVPLQVRLADRVGSAGVDVWPADVAAALAARLPVSTSQPSPAAFVAALRTERDVVAVHLSGRLSGTVDGARRVARELAGETGQGAVEVVDSRSATMGLGFVVLSAVRVASAGGAYADVLAAAHAAIGRTSVLHALDTLEHARRGGRLSAAQAVVGAALSVKPIVHLVDGTLEPLERVRTGARALQRLEDLAVARAAGGRVDVAVHHLVAQARAEQLAGRLRERLAGRLVCLQVSEVGAVVGAHGGPGLVGVVVHRR